MFQLECILSSLKDLNPSLLTNTSSFVCECEQQPGRPAMFTSAPSDSGQKVGRQGGERFLSVPTRLRQQSAAELKNGGQNGGVAGGAREVFGSWLQDGRRGRELLLDRDRKLAEDASGRLTG